MLLGVSWRATGAELELSDARTTGAKLELSDARTSGPSWTRRRWLPSRRGGGAIVRSMTRFPRSAMIANTWSRLTCSGLVESCTLSSFTSPATASPSAPSATHSCADRSSGEETLDLPATWWAAPKVIEAGDFHSSSFPSTLNPVGNPS
jgi:hypothetical protein